MEMACRISFLSLVKDNGFGMYMLAPSLLELAIEELSSEAEKMMTGGFLVSA